MIYVHYDADISALCAACVYHIDREPVAIVLCIDGGDSHGKMFAACAECAQDRNMWVVPIEEEET